MVAAAASMGRQLELAVLHMQLFAYHLPSASAAQHTTAEPASAAAASCHMLAPAPAQLCTMSRVQRTDVFHMLWFDDNRKEERWRDRDGTCQTSRVVQKVCMFISSS